jgi:MerR family regulatory protein
MTTLTIGQVGALTGLTTHTLRFYEQERLFFAPVRAPRSRSTPVTSPPAQPTNCGATDPSATEFPASPLCQDQVRHQG